MSHRIQMSTMEMMDTRKEILHSFLLFMLVNQVFTPYDSFEEACHQLNVDVTLLALYATLYLNGRDHSVPKCTHYSTNLPTVFTPLIYYHQLSHGEIYCLDKR